MRERAGRKCTTGDYIVLETEYKKKTFYTREKYIQILYNIKVVSKKIFCVRACMQMQVYYLIIYINFM